MLGLFFENLEREQKNVRTYVQDALSSMIEIYVNIKEDSPIYKDLQNIILLAVQKVLIEGKLNRAIFFFSNFSDRVTHTHVIWL